MISDGLRELRPVAAVAVAIAAALAGAAACFAGVLISFGYWIECGYGEAPCEETFIRDVFFSATAPVALLFAALLVRASFELIGLIRTGKAMRYRLVVAPFAVFGAWVLGLAVI